MPRYDYNVPEPTAAYVASRRQQFAGDPNYYGVETSLQLLFNSWPRNSKIDEVLAKASCLDRLYSTNVYAIVPMAEQIVSLEIDTALDVGDLEPVNEALVEVVAGRDGQLRPEVEPLAAGAGSRLPADLHAVGVEEVDLAAGVHEAAAGRGTAAGASHSRHLGRRVLGTARRGVAGNHDVGAKPFFQADARTCVSETVATGFRCGS